MIEKLRTYFDEMTVCKDLKNNGFFSTLNLPSFMRDWLLQRYGDEDGEFDPDEIAAFVKKNIPKPDEWESIKSRIVGGEEVCLIAKIAGRVDVATGAATFELPDYKLTAKDSLIDEYVWNECRDALTKGEVWGRARLGYRCPDPTARPKIPGKIRLLAFDPFCPYEKDIDYYKDARAKFATDEWIDVLLGAIDYNPAGYRDSVAKLTMLTRLIPFVEKNVNLIELAPKGTGKSYLFGKVSRFGWLVSGGVVSRAQMFCNVQKRADGLVAHYDFLTLDEAQTISFSDDAEMAGALKSYLENGYCNIANRRVDGDAGVVLCGNVPIDKMDAFESSNMIEDLSSVFHESALIDRFHGLIKGWNLPRMNDDLKVAGWALNTEYFTSILHDLRDDASYRAIVDQLLEIPPRADTRDVTAIKRIATGYLKLLFPHVRSVDDVDRIEFKTYCLDRAATMRESILRQLARLDREYRGRDVPAITLKS